MKEFKNSVRISGMKKKHMILSGGLITLIALILILTLPRSIGVILNGEAQTLQTRAWTVQAALENGGLTLNPQDSIQPTPDKSLLGVDQIVVDQARPVYIEEYPSGKVTLIYSASRDGEQLLASAGITPTEEDKVQVNGQLFKTNQPLPYAPEYRFEVKHAVVITIDSPEGIETIQSSADSLGDALQNAGYEFHPADRLDLPLETVLDQDLTVTIQRALPITITLKDQTIPSFSAADTVGEALAEVGISLQNLDYSIPAETDPLPTDGNIRVVRVREEATLTQTSIPYTSEYIQSDQVELDKTEIVQPGEFGVEVTRTLVRYEDGQEVKRIDDTTWVAKQPQNQVTGRGTKPVVKTMETPDGTIEYWRAVTVHATSYSPCRSGVDACYYGTSSGLPVQRGVIGVTRTWYNLMVGQQVYVPGYGKGIIADIGGGIPGEYWIDLGFTDADFEPWSSWTTMYFLTPVPDYIPWILP